MVRTVRREGFDEPRPQRHRPEELGVLLQHRLTAGGVRRLREFHGAIVRGAGDTCLSPRYRRRVQTAVDIGPVRPEEHAEAGAVTARAYEEFVPRDRTSSGWTAYLERLADVAGRAARTLVLVARVDGVIAGTATLETSVRINPESPQGPLAPDEVHLRMLAV